ncbi:MAG: type II secretion system protein N [Syntrophales bacterium]|nr:type II secretion system protein N [Syntrophales bacterium]
MSITVLSYLSVDIFYRVTCPNLIKIRAGGIPVEKTIPRKIVKKPPLNSYGSISERNLFGTTGKAFLKEQIDIDQLEPTTLNLTLLGTVAGARDFDYAVIEETDKKKQGLFRIGDTIASATVVKIMRGRVALRVGGRDEILVMEEKPDKDTEIAKQTASDSRSSITVRKTEIDEALKNVSKTLTQARIRPYFSAGKSEGFVISRIKEGSIFQKMGMQNGDVIQSVNKQPIKSPDEIMELYTGLKSGSAISLNIERRGKKQDLEYIFE